MVAVVVIVIFCVPFLNTTYITDRVGATHKLPTSLTYVWQGGITADWQSPVSWTPVRDQPAVNDTLVFSSGGPTTATNVPTQTIGQLIVAESTAVNLEATGPAFLTLGSAEGIDLVVGPFSALNLGGVNPIEIDLVPGSKGEIQGTIMFSATGNANHRLTAPDKDGLTFREGAMFTAGTGLTGHPFGTNHLNSVVFADGSSYVCVAGSDPFGAAAPDAVAVFEKGSLFSLQGNVTPSFSGRKYANFEVNVPGGVITATGEEALIMDDLILAQGRLNLNMTRDPGHSIKGDIVISTGAYLDFSPMTHGTIYLNGTTTQTISGGGGQAASGTSTLAIDNPSGVVVQDRPLLAANLNLLRGVITVSPDLYIVAGLVVTRTNGYVNGILIRSLWSSGRTVFDVGTEHGYSPITVDATAGNFPVLFNVRAIEAPQPNILLPSKALSRYWQLTEYDPITADLTFSYIDRDVPATANEQAFMVQRHDGSVFNQPGGIVDTQANTFRVNGVTEFARDWTLAEPIAVGGPSPTPTPTPTPVPEFDLTVSQDAPQTAGIGGELVYTLTASILPTALGGSASPLVRFNFPNGAQSAFVRSSGTNGYTAATDSSGVSFSGGTIATSGTNPGTATLTVTVRPLSPGILTSNGGDVVIDPGNLILETNENNNSAQTIQTTVVEPNAAFDYDGDGRTDLSVFRPTSGVWYLNKSTDGFRGLQFGAEGDKLTPADYDGDGKTDIAVYRPSAGQWYVLNSATSTVTYPVFGVAEDVPAPGDYDGDGKADLTVFRPSQRTWYRQNSSNGMFFGFQFGATGDVPTVGDFDGDGKNDLGIFRPSVGDWYNIRSSNGSVFGERFGQTGDRIAPADYDGDGKTDIAIFRPSTGLWVVRNSATSTYSYSVFGSPNDVPISGDYDGDGKADIGVWRPSDGTWYVKRSDNGQFIVFPWGQNGDVPTPAAYGN